MTRSSILITGAGGFVGAHLAEGFRDLGYDVTALDAMFDQSARRRLDGVTLREVQLGAAALDDCPPVDFVVHAAALTSAPGELGLSPAAHMQANLETMLASLDWATRTGARSFVFVSSSGVFAADDAAEILVESVPPSGTGAYALAKRAGEVIAGGSATLTLSVLVVRLGYVYGPFEAARASRSNVSLIRHWLDDARAGRPLAVQTPFVRRDWTYVRDLPRALNALLTSEASGLFHVGSGAIESDVDVAEAIACAMHVAVDIRPSGDASRAKAPMGRGRPSALDSLPWTTLADGISETLRLEAAV